MPDQTNLPGVRLLDQALTRAAGAPLVSGNRVRLLRDAAENYPAWLAAIQAARRHVYFESYIIWDDAIGDEFAEVFASKAREGVRVRVIYDWLGAFGKTSASFWRRLRQAGVEVRCFNPPQVTSPFGWISRDHRKTIAVDSEIAFVSGLCVGELWRGNPAKGREPWRDTGIELRGPAVADVERAFANVWAELGRPLPKGERDKRTTLPRPGSMRVRIVATHPGSAGLFRLDHIVAAAARKTLWLTDAYFAGVPPYVAALQAASRDGVDVRLLVPGASDIPALRPLTQSGYRPLLMAGVRVFEWNGAMLHAKTAVADGRWSRVGSSNLNVASWLGNYELDAVIENEEFAGEMERMYLDDLRNATEIVLERRRRPRTKRKTVRAGGSVSRVAAGAIRLGNVVNAAMTARRVLPAPDRRIYGVSGLLLLISAFVFIWRPRLIAVPLSIVAAVTGLALVLTALGRSKKVAPAAMPNRGHENPR